VPCVTQVSSPEAANSLNHLKEINDMTTAIAPQLEPDNHEGEGRPTTVRRLRIATPPGRASHSFDPTEGRKIGSDPYDDPTQGVRIGSPHYDDPTQGARIGTAPYDDPTQGVRTGSHPHEDPTHGRKIGSDPYDDPTRAR
jgi:hypothetical protein